MVLHSIENGLHNIAYGLNNIADGLHNIAYWLHNIADGQHNTLFIIYLFYVYLSASVEFK